MAQQTAIEWLIWELERCGYFMINDHFPITLEQAKDKEKEQIMENFKDGKDFGYEEGLKTCEDDGYNEKLAEVYYIEKYNK